MLRQLIAPSARQTSERFIFYLRVAEEGEARLSLPPAPCLSLPTSLPPIVPLRRAPYRRPSRRLSPSRSLPPAPVISLPPLPASPSCHLLASRSFPFPSNMPVALVAGVTGMADLSMAKALKKPIAPGGPWVVYGAALCPIPSWFPPSLLHQYFQFDALDPHATHQAPPHFLPSSPTSSGSPSNHIKPNPPTSPPTPPCSPMSSKLSPPRHPPDRHQTLHGPRHRPSHPPSARTPPAIPTPTSTTPSKTSSTPSPGAPYSFAWSIHCSSLIFDASSRSRYNTILTLATYALLCRRERPLFRFPGTAYTWEHFYDASSAGVLAQQHMWAATTSAAKNQAFNCTNGVVFTWKAL